MFERFDDDVAFRPDAAFRDAVVGRGQRLRRRRRTLAGLSSLAVVVGLLGGTALYVDRRDQAIDRIDVSTEPSTDGAVNVLLVGTDGPIADGARADSIAVLRLDDTGSHLLSVPRDLYDEAAGDRVNQAMVEGPQALIDAVHRTVGIPIDNYVAIDPRGFAALVDAAGGLRLAITAPIVDAPTGLSLQPAECATLDGTTALALARARHADPSGDLGRIARQQVMLGAALDQLDADPVTIDRLSRLLADHAQVDDGLDLAALVRLGTRLATGPTLVTDVLPVEPLALPNGAQVLRLAPGAPQLAAAYGAPAPPGADTGIATPGTVPLLAPCP
jgi:LCP family protein required for cell wall assembly